MNVIFECQFCGKQSRIQNEIAKCEAEHRAAIHKQNMSASDEESKTCELCGAPTHSNFKTVCDKCASGYKF